MAAQRAAAERDAAEAAAAADRRVADQRVRSRAALRCRRARRDLVGQCLQRREGPVRQHVAVLVQNGKEPHETPRCLKGACCTPQGYGCMGARLRAGAAWLS